MIKLTNEQLSFLRKNGIVESVIQNGTKREILLELHYLMMDKGFYYEGDENFYNDFGKEAQRVYDDIVEQNKI